MTFTFQADFKQWQLFEQRLRNGGDRWPSIAQEMYVDVGRIIHDQIWLAYTTEIGGGFHSMPAIASGSYGDNLLITPTNTGVIVSATARYAGYLELGTAPHIPPVSAIAAWMDAKGMEPEYEDAVRVANAIGRRGTLARHFIRDVFRKPGTMVQINRRINEGIRELAVAMGFGGNAPL